MSTSDAETRFRLQEAALQEAKERLAVLREQQRQQTVRKAELEQLLRGAGIDPTKPEAEISRLEQEIDTILEGNEQLLATFKKQLTETSVSADHVEFD